MRLAVACLALLAASSLGAQEWMAGVQVQCDSALDLWQPSLARDLRYHTGAGVGLNLARTLGNRQELRAYGEFTGTHVANWTHSDPQHGRERLNDTWRSIRFGLEHVLPVTGEDEEGLTAFYGAGIQDSWVNRNTGSWLETTLMGGLWMSGAGSGPGQGTEQNIRATRCESWRPFVSAGLGYRMGPQLGVDLRYLAGAYLRDRTYALRTTGSSTTEEQYGHQLELALTWRTSLW